VAYTIRLDDPEELLLGAVTFGLVDDNSDDLIHPGFPSSDTGVHPFTAAPRVPTYAP
jgi:hypothetical protein